MATWAQGGGPQRVRGSKSLPECAEMVRTTPPAGSLPDMAHVVRGRQILRCSDVSNPRGLCSHELIMCLGLGVPFLRLAGPPQAPPEAKIAP